jgi:hypothetical protein
VYNQIWSKFFFTVLEPCVYVRVYVQIMLIIRQYANTAWSIAGHFTSQDIPKQLIKKLTCSRNNQHNAQICTTALFYCASQLSSWVHTSVYSAGKHNNLNHATLTHRPLNHIIWWTTIWICIFTWLRRIQKLPEDGRLLMKHVGASI